MVHIFRETNRCADFMANLSHGGNFQHIVMDRAPPVLGLFLRDDALGLSTPHLIS